MRVGAPRVAELKVWPNGPETGLVGGKVVYQVTVQNQGTGPAANVVLKAAFDGGLECDQGGASGIAGGHADGRRVEDRGAAGAAKAGGRGHGEADGAWRRRPGGAGRAAAAGAGRPADAAAFRTGPRLRRPAGGVGPGNRQRRRHARESGDGERPTAPELVFVEATDGGRPQGREVVWNVGDLPPGGRKLLHLTTTSPRPTPKAANTATAAARAGGDAAAEVRVQANADLAVLGLPAYRMTVEDRDDPVEVGGRTAYRVMVTNTGSLPGERVQVTATFPAEMRLVTAIGPTTYSVNGARVAFTPLATLAPGQTLTYVVEVEAAAGRRAIPGGADDAAPAPPVVRGEHDGALTRKFPPRIRPADGGPGRPRNRPSHGPEKQHRSSTLPCEENTREALSIPRDVLDPRHRCRVGARRPGSWEQVGPAGAWQPTLAGAVLNGRLYTTESNGGLYATDLDTGEWRQLGAASSATPSSCSPRAIPSTP